MDNFQKAVTAYVSENGSIDSGTYSCMLRVFTESNKYDDGANTIIDVKNNLISDILDSYNKFKSSRCFNFEGYIAAKELCYSARVEFSTFENALENFYKAFIKIKNSFVASESVKESNDYIKSIIDSTSKTIKAAKKGFDSDSGDKLDKSAGQHKAKIAEAMTIRIKAIKKAMEGFDSAFGEFISCAMEGDDPKNPRNGKDKGFQNEYKIVLKALKLLKVQYEILSGYIWDTTNVYFAIDWTSYLTTYIRVVSPHAAKIGPLRKLNDRNKLDSIEKKIAKLKDRR